MTETIWGFVALTSEGKRRVIRVDQINCIEEPDADGKVYVWWGSGCSMEVDEPFDEVISKIRAESFVPPLLPPNPSCCGAYSSAQPWARHARC